MNHETPSAISQDYIVMPISMKSPFRTRSQNPVHMQARVVSATTKEEAGSEYTLYSVEGNTGGWRGALGRCSAASRTSWACGLP